MNEKRIKIMILCTALVVISILAYMNRTPSYGEKKITEERTLFYLGQVSDEKMYKYVDADEDVILYVLGFYSGYGEDRAVAVVESKYDWSYSYENGLTKKLK